MTPATVNAGDTIFVPCEVAAGPFSDQRRVVVRSEAGEWIGFVPVEFIEDPDSEHSLVHCTILEVCGDRFVARIPGYAAVGPPFTGYLDRAAPRVGTVEA